MHARVFFSVVLSIPLALAVSASEIPSSLPYSGSGYDDPVLGAIALRDTGDVVEEIRAHQLWDLVQPISFDEFVKRQSQSLPDPSAAGPERGAAPPPEKPLPLDQNSLRASYVKQVSRQVSQVLALKLLAGILDTEARLRDPTAFDVSDESVEGVARKLLETESPRLSGIPASRPATSEELDAYRARFADPGIDTIPRPELLYMRLAKAVASNPYQLVASAGESLSPLVLAEEGPNELVASAGDSLSPLVLAGEGPLPPTLSDFLPMVRGKLAALQRLQARRNEVLFELKRKYPDLYSRERPIGPITHATQIYNPFGPARFPVQKSELDELYSDRAIFDQVARRAKQEFTLIEISIASCATAFKEAFSSPFVEKQQKLRGELEAATKAGTMVREQAVEKIGRSRMAIVRESFEQALAAIRTACLQPGARIAETKVTVGSRDPDANDELERARREFIAQWRQDPKLQGTMIPHVSRLEAGGVVRHFFLETIGTPIVTELTRDDPEVTAALRDILAERRVSQMTARAIHDLVLTRYRVRVEREPFEYGGMEGYKLHSALAELENWLGQVFRQGDLEMLEAAYAMP